MESINLSPIAVLLTFTTLNESLIEYMFGSIIPLRPYLPIVALITAICLTFAYQINFFTSILNIQSGIPVMDFILSGFIISRGSNFVNDFVRKFLGSK